VDNPRFLATQMVNFLHLRPSDKPTTANYAEAATRFHAPEQGEYMFRTRCAACHTIGKGDSVGPDLAGLTTRREKAWVARYLREPEKMLAEKEPIATALYEQYKQVRMPNLALSDDEIGAILGQIEKLSPPPQKTARNMAMP
jgi:protein SCO1/2